MRPALLAGLVGATVGAAIMLLALPSDLFGRVPKLTGIVRAAPEQVAVVDGETLLLQRTVIRLEGIAAPSRGQSCGGANGAALADCGAASAAALAELVRGRNVSCTLDGRDHEGLAQGMCEAAGTELNRSLVAAGWAHASNMPSGFADEEARARGANRGLWADGSF
jgi:endonuclease YncB( thermonuclease family)